MHKFTGQYPCGSAISIKLQSNFIEITLFGMVFYCKFAAYFQNIFFKKQLWRTASAF